jgi:hypothetical protein
MLSLLIVDLTHPAGVLSPEPELGQTSAVATMPYSRIPTPWLPTLPLEWFSPSAAPFPRRRESLVSGRRVKGLPEGTARRAALDAVAASWTIRAEADG